MNPPVFLLSSERSGTNLLRRRFTEYQRDYFGPVPLHLLKHLYWAEPYYGSLEIDENFETFIKDALGLAYHHFSPWDEEITVNQVRAEYESLFFGSRSSVGVMHVFYMLYAQSKGYSSYFCKDNNLFDFVSDIKLELPTAKFIYLYRDPRDVVVSQLKRPLQNKSIAFLSELWRDEQIKCIRCSDFLSKNDDVMMLSYEEFITREYECIDALCSFLDVNVLDKRTNFSSKELTDIQEWKNLDKPTITDNSGKFREHLSAKQIKKIESICWHQMCWLGYKPTFDQRKTISAKTIWLESFIGKVKRKLSSRFQKADITVGQIDRSKYTKNLRDKWK